jgi:hypothetical protein
MIPFAVTSSAILGSEFPSIFQRPAAAYARSAVRCMPVEDLTSHSLSVTEAAPAYVS